MLLVKDERCQIKSMAKVSMELDGGCKGVSFCLLTPCGYVDIGGSGLPGLLTVINKIIND